MEGVFVTVGKVSASVKHLQAQRTSHFNTTSSVFIPFFCVFNMEREIDSVVTEQLCLG